MNWMSFFTLIVSSLEELFCLKSIKYTIIEIEYILRMLLMETKKIEVFELCKVFRKLEAYNQYEEDQLFIIEVKELNETFYCSLINEGEGEPGIDIYRDEMGLYSYLEQQYVRSKSLELLFARSLNHIEGFGVRFTDRKELLDEDYNQIKEVGLTFRGKKQWPYIRFFTAGYIPKIDEHLFEWEILSTVLYELVKLLQKLDNQELQLEKNSFIHAKVEENQTTYEFTPKQELLNKRDFNISKVIFGDELMIHRLNKLRQSEVVLEGMQLSFEESQYDSENGDWIYPDIAVFMDRSSKGIVVHSVTRPDSHEENQIIEQLIKFMLEFKVRPKTIYVEDLILFNQLEDFTKKLSIECVVKETPNVVKYFEGLALFMKQDELITDDFDDDDVSDELVMNIIRGLEAHDEDEFDWDDDFDDEDLDDLDEDEMLDLIDGYIEDIVEHTVAGLIEHGVLKSLSTNKLEIYSQALEIILTTMLLAKEEAPLSWTEEGLKDLLNSKILEQMLLEVHPKINAKKEIDTILRDYSKLLKKVDESKQATVIEKALVKYYK